MIKPPLKWWGGKKQLASRLHRLAPQHIHRVYGCAGGLGEFWGWPHEGISEVANDSNLEIVNFWRVLREDDTFEKFRRKVESVPFSRAEWIKHTEAARGRVGEIITPDVDEAVSLFIRCRMSRSGAFKDFTPLSKTRTRRNMNEQVSAWLTTVNGLPEVHQRLIRIVLEHLDVCDIIRREDRPGTLFYLDPPYHPDVRAVPDAYEEEMDIPKHEELIELIRNIQGKVMLSGYRNDLYDTELRDWSVVEWNRPNQAAGGTTKRRMIECVYMNYPADQRGFHYRSIT